MKRAKPEKRFYRQFAGKRGVSFEISAGESDLWIYLPGVYSVSESLTESLLEYLVLLRKQLEMYIEKNPDFLGSLVPIKVKDVLLPEIVRVMLDASSQVGVGPMAGVAGAINRFIGKKLEDYGFNQYIIENGGDVLILSEKERTLRIYTGNPGLDNNIALEVPTGRWGVCSSSSKIGHSLSFGSVTIATIVAEDVVVADCAATFVANSRTPDEIVSRVENLVDKGMISGAFCSMKDKVIIKGDIKLVRLK
ncbi:UPF0280 family protein [Desulfurobacterium sp.]